MERLKDDLLTHFVPLSRPNQYSKSVELMHTFLSKAPAHRGSVGEVRCRALRSESNLDTTHVMSHTVIEATRRNECHSVALQFKLRKVNGIRVMMYTPVRCHFHLRCGTEKYNLTTTAKVN